MLNSTGQKTLYGLMNMLYPVGSYYITESSDLNTVDKMNAYFGGTWERIQNMFLLGAGGIYDVGKEGGETRHTLTIGEMPSHTHDYYRMKSGGTTWWVQGKEGTIFSQEIIKTDHSGNGQSHNNMPPYRAVYMYRRKSLAI